MTLNITVVTPKRIYQCADYRLVDVNTSKAADIQTQKIFVTNTFKWSATVCFAGVGSVGKLDVGTWLSERLGTIQLNDPFERLIEELLKADKWLGAIPAPHNKHSFSVGAYIGGEPVFALVSNFEAPSGRATAAASARLSAFECRPSKPRTFIAGQRHEVSRLDKRRLSALAAGNCSHENVYSALTEVNRSIAVRNKYVSPACFTTHLLITGESGGKGHGVSNARLPSPQVMPLWMEEVIDRLVKDKLGPGGGQLDGFSTTRFEATDECHQIQLREKPNDPNVHSNYGAFLKDIKKDAEEAERAYRNALALDDNHPNALGNLANLYWERGQREQADSLYNKALKAEPGHENVTWNYTRLLLQDPEQREAASKVLDQGILAHPESGRLYLLRGELALHYGSPSRALEDYRLAREKRANQALAEQGYAFALHLTGAPIGKCIEAYRTAIGLNPKNAALRLNLAQLLFIKGDNAQANDLLFDAMRLGLDESAQLEAQFYLLLSSNLSAPEPIFDAIRSLLARGARLRWNVQPNIDSANRKHPNKATLLKRVSEVMAGLLEPTALIDIAAQWPSSSNGIRRAR